MKTYLITYRDTLLAYDIDDAYERFLEQLSQDVNHADVTAFSFQEVSNAGVK